MAASHAWVLNLGQGLRVAVGEFDMIHLVPSPELQPVPMSPPYCREVILWEDAVIPVMDLAAFLQRRESSSDTAVVGIVEVQAPQEAQAPLYGGLRLEDPPIRATVNDGQACGLPDSPSGWDEIAISCFEDERGAVPILSLQRLFSISLSEPFVG